jgi:hypothetical protein
MRGVENRVRRRILGPEGVEVAGGLTELFSEEGGYGGEAYSCHGRDAGKFVQVFLAVNIKGNIIDKLPVTQ